MKVSVVIPAFNAEATIRATVDSVLGQTVRPHEILVMDDGSTDNTSVILDSYRPHVTVFRQANGGLSSGRNFLCLRAQGDLIAFLDSDDVWHPSYLQVQLDSLQRYPTAVAGFTGHVNFRSDGNYEWDQRSADINATVELMPPLKFFEKYNSATGFFASYSYCCVTKEALTKMGVEPFKADGAEDFFSSALLALLGPVVYSGAPVAAYRIREGSISSDRIRGLAARVHAFELLESEHHYTSRAGPELAAAFRLAFASHRRSYAKQLFGASKVADARTQLRLSLKLKQPVSFGKSLALLWLSYLPSRLQPSWPQSYQR